VGISRRWVIASKYSNSEPMEQDQGIRCQSQEYLAKIRGANTMHKYYAAGVFGLGHATTS